MNRWKIAGAISLLFLALLAFTIIQSCRRVNQPQRAEEDPETLDTRATPPAPSDTGALSMSVPSALASMQQITVRGRNKRVLG